MNHKALYSDPAYADFDAETYLLQNPDVAQAGLDPLFHFITHGRNEGRKYTRFPRTPPKMWSEIDKSGLFDSDWYLERYNDAAEYQKGALMHFLEIGLEEGRDPGPGFSVSWYLAQNPDVAGINAVLHYIEYGCAEGRMPIPPANALSTAEKVYASVRDLDAQLTSLAAFDSMRHIPFVNYLEKPRKIVASLEALLAQTPDTVTHLIFVPWCRHSGADRVAANVAMQALTSLGSEKVALVVVDEDRVDSAGWFPPHLRRINFAASTENLTPPEKELALEKYLAICRPLKCMNVNSALVWRLYRNRGRVLSLHYTELYACLFCSDYDLRGAAIGYGDLFLRDALPWLSAIYFDNQTYLSQVFENLGVVGPDKRKLHLLRQPATIYRSHRAGRSKEEDMHVLWASRICKQKNTELLYTIMRSAVGTPIHFHIWGSGNADELRLFQDATSGLLNCTYHGNFSDFEELPHHEYHAYLYTSLWDGIPNVLLEAASVGYPVIASNAGGICELVTEETGWLVEDLASPDGYMAALNEIFEKPASAEARANALRRYVRNHHNWDDFGKSLESNGGFLSARN